MPIQRVHKVADLPRMMWPAFFRLVLVFSLFVSQAVSASDALSDSARADSSTACGPLPEEAQLANRLDDAVRFAIDPKASSEMLEVLATDRPEHFLAVAPAFTLAGKSSQIGDFRMLTVTSPATVDHSVIQSIGAAITKSSAGLDKGVPDLNALWQKILDTHPIDGQDAVGWACLRTRPIETDVLKVVLAHGHQACGILERADGWPEVVELIERSSSHRYTVLSLLAIEGRDVDIRNTELTAPVYAIDQIDFSE